MLAVSAVGGLALGTLLAGDPAGALGIYAQSAGNVDVLGTMRWMAGNLSALALYLTAIPVAATIAVIVRAVTRSAGRADVLYASVTLAAVTCVMAVVAAFGSTGESSAEGFVGSATQLRERNFFLVAPLLLIGLAMWTQRRDRSRKVFLIAAGGALLLLATYPWHNAPVAAGPQNLAPVPWFVVSDSNVWRSVGVVVLGLLALALLRLTPWSKTGRLWVAIAAVFSLTGLFAALVFANAGDRTVAWGLGLDPTWIDHAVPAGSKVGVVWYEPGSGFATPVQRHRVVWVNEYFNDSLGTVYTIGGRMPYNLPEERAVVVTTAS